MKKKLAVFLSALVVVLVFASHIPSKDLNATAIVQAMGIDLHDGNIELTLQIFSSQSSGSRTAIDISVNNAVIITSKGKTVAEALNNATMLQGKKISMGHNRAVVIGRELAESGIEGVFRYLDRNSLVRQNVQFLLAENTAKEIVSADIVEDILAAEVIEKIINNGSENGYIYNCPYYILSVKMYSHDGAGAMPIISLQPEKKEESSSDSQGDSGQKSTITSTNTVKIDKAGVFKDYKLIDTLDNAQTRGLIFLSDYIEETLLLVEAEDLKASLKIVSYNSKLKPTLDDKGNPVFLFKANAKVTIDELLTEREVVLDEETISFLEQKAIEIITEECKSAFEKTVNKDKCDLLNMSDLLLRYEKEYFYSIKDNFKESLNNISLKTDIDLSINKTGMEANQ